MIHFFLNIINFVIEIVMKLSQIIVHDWF